MNTQTQTAAAHDAVTETTTMTTATDIDTTPSTATSEGDQISEDFDTGRALFNAGQPVTHCECSDQVGGWEYAQESKWADEDDALRESLDQHSIFKNI